MKLFIKIIAIISIFPLLIGVYFLDNIKGYYRFKYYCEKEGGLRVFEPIKKGVAFLAENRRDARTAAILENVSFVRYKDEDGVFYDIKYIGGHPQNDSSYEKNKSDLSVPINYEWRFINSFILGELRLSRFGYEILDVSKKTISVKYNVFYYSQFDRSKTLLDAPSAVGCFNNFSKDYRKKSPVFEAIDSAFKD